MLFVMKYSIVLLFTVALFACSTRVDYTDFGDRWIDVQQRGHGTLKALYVPADGFAYLDEQGNLTGVTVDLLNEFSSYLATHYDIILDVDFVEETHWRTFYDRIKHGGDGLIGLGNVTITDERSKELRFSKPYMTNIAALITHDEVAELESLDEIADRFTRLTALAFEGTLHEERLKHLIEKRSLDIDWEYVQSNDEIIDKISEGHSYFAYIDIYNVWRALERGHKIRRHPIADLTSEQFGYILPLNTSWGEILDEFFQHDGGLVHGTRYHYIMKKHLGEQLANILIEQ